MQNKEQSFLALIKDALPAFIITIIPILVFSIETWGNNNWAMYGIEPRTFKGFRGVFFSPLLHGDWKHLMSNSIPLFVLSWLIRLHFKDIWVLVFGFIWAASGVWTWIIGGGNYIIGSSGIVYGLAAFAITAGFISKNKQAQGIGLFTLFFYGSLIWGIFPLEMNLGISWQGHLSGLIAGVLVALVLRPNMPEKPKYSWEIEPEEDIPVEEQYWRLDYKPKDEIQEDNTHQPPSIAPPRYIIRYIFKEKNDSTNSNS